MILKTINDAILHRLLFLIQSLSEMTICEEKLDSEKSLLFAFISNVIPKQNNFYHL